MISTSYPRVLAIHILVHVRRLVYPSSHYKYVRTYVSGRLSSLRPHTGTTATVHTHTGTTAVHVSHGGDIFNIFQLIFSGGLDLTTKSTVVCTHLGGNVKHRFLSSYVSYAYTQIDPKRYILLSCRLLVSNSLAYCKTNARFSTIFKLLDSVH